MNLIPLNQEYFVIKLRDGSFLGANGNTRIPVKIRLYTSKDAAVKAINDKRTKIDPNKLLDCKIISAGRLVFK